MKTTGTLALLFALAAAAPLNKRDIVWHTEVVEVVETVAMTTTVWVDQLPTSAAAPTSVAAAATSSAAAFPEVHSSFVLPSSVAAPASSTPTPTPSSSTPAYTPPASSAPAYTPPASSSISSVYVAPSSTPAPSSAAPVTSAAPAYTPPTTTSAAAAATSSAASSSGSGTYSGQLTWYDAGLGSCGITSGASDPIVAISHELFDSKATANPNNNPFCNQKITINYGGKSFSATIVDRCTGCAYGDLDLSKDFFNTVTNNGDGRVSGMTWSMA